MAAESYQDTRVVRFLADGNGLSIFDAKIRPVSFDDETVRRVRDSDRFPEIRTYFETMLGGPQLKSYFACPILVHISELDLRPRAAAFDCLGHLIGRRVGK